MDNSCVRIGAVALMINIIFDLVTSQSISDFNIGTALIIILFSIFYITIVIDKIKRNNK